MSEFFSTLSGFVMVLSVIGALVIDTADEVHVRKIFLLALYSIALGVIAIAVK